MLTDGRGRASAHSIPCSPPTQRQITIGGQRVGLVRRRRISSESIGILIDPRHEGVDLRGGPDSYKRESGTYDAEAMRAARPATQGLLIIYPLDAADLLIDHADTVVALALSLPNTSDAGTSVGHEQDDVKWLTVRRQRTGPNSGH